MPKRRSSELPEYTTKKAKNAATTDKLLRPNCTLYLHNLNDRIPVSTLRYNLYILFSTYCEVLRIYYKNKGSLRGQAWIIVSSIEEAELALIRLKGLSVFGKKLEMEFSDKTSHVIRASLGDDDEEMS